MGAAKLFVWGEGVWRELDVASGRVSGWRRRARFVFVRRGRLQVARRRAVLRALQALVAGRPGAAADGLRLSHRSKSAVRSSKQKHEASVTTPAPAPAPAPAPCAHHLCCAHYNGCNNANLVMRDTGTVSLVPATKPVSGAAQRMREAGTQCTQHAITINLNHANNTRRDSSGDEFVSPGAARRPPPAPARTSASDVNALLTRYRPGPKSRRVPPPRAPRSPRPPRHASVSSDDGRASEPSGRRTHDTESSPATKRTPTSVNVTKKAAGRGGRGGRGGVCKELIISESDVAALRGFVARTRASALARFDADDEYKRALFYAINPLVELEQCARLQRMLRASEAHARERFAARLGLAPRSDDSARASPAPRASRASLAQQHRRDAALRCLQRTTSSSSMDTDKENKEDKHTPTSSRERHERGAKSKVRAAPTPSGDTARVTRLGESARANKGAGGAGGGSGGAGARAGAAPAPPADKRPPPVATDTHVISKRSSAGGGKEYSNLEDHAIVAWVSSGARASLVNGNRVWRELQEQYPRLAGRSRSWHSLRNRYLRYILPGLRALRLPPGDESRLRAAAATGAIKRKNRALGAAGAGAGPGAARRNSMFKEVALRGASSRRPPRAPPPPPPHHEGDDDDSDVTYKPTAATAQDLGAASGLRRSLRTEAREQDGGGQDAGGQDSGGQDGGGQDSGGRARAASRSPRYSDVTRRFAARRRAAGATSSPRTPPSPHTSATAAVTSRSRRLYNPNADM